MNYLIPSMLGVLLLWCSACKPSIEELAELAPIEEYPNDTFLAQATNKKALVIVAHDDDDCAMSGTLAGLAKSGWQVKQLCLQNTTLKAGRTNHPAVELSIENELLIGKATYRNITDSINHPWMPIPLKEIDSSYETELVKQALIQKINAFRPAVIFTLDHEMGGYGHPDHVFISRLVVSLYQNGELPPVKIYQSVFTDHMEREIIDKRLSKKMEEWGFPSPSLTARKMYGLAGMPEPSVQVNIQAHSLEKMNYLRAYHKKARKNLRKFMPHFEDIPHDKYFGLFNREFFRVLTFEQLSSTN